MQKKKLSKVQKRTRTEPIEYKTSLKAKGVCKYCAPIVPEDCTVEWIANGNGFVVVGVTFETCGHRYTQNVKFKQWQNLLKTARDGS